MSGAVEIWGKCESWDVLHQGKILGSATGYDAACCRARTIERQLRQAPRLCMCCNVAFLSDGIGNRLCDRCKRDFA